MNFLRSSVFPSACNKVLNKFLLALPFMVIATVQACPDCALQNSGGVIEPKTMAAKAAFSSSILLMIGIFCSVLGFMIWIMIKTCRELAQERALSSPREA